MVTICLFSRQQGAFWATIGYGGVNRSVVTHMHAPARKGNRLDTA